VLKATNLRVIATGDMLQYISCLLQVSWGLLYNGHQRRRLAAGLDSVFRPPGH